MGLAYLLPSPRPSSIGCPPFPSRVTAFSFGIHSSTSHSFFHPTAHSIDHLNLPKFSDCSKAADHGLHSLLVSVLPNHFFPNSFLNCFPSHCPSSVLSLLLILSSLFLENIVQFHSCHQHLYVDNSQIFISVLSFFLNIITTQQTFGRQFHLDGPQALQRQHIQIQTLYLPPLSLLLLLYSLLHHTSWVF